MSKQIAVRLPDDLVDFVDSLVAAGSAKSRAAVIAGALARERRRAAAERDVEILMREGDDEDLMSMVSWMSAQPLDLD